MFRMKSLCNLASSVRQQFTVNVRAGGGYLPYNRRQKHDRQERGDAKTAELSSRGNCSVDISSRVAGCESLGVEHIMLLLS